MCYKDIFPLVLLGANLRIYAVDSCQFLVIFQHELTTRCNTFQAPSHRTTQQLNDMQYPKTTTCEAVNSANESEHTVVALVEIF